MPSDQQSQSGDAPYSFTGGVNINPGNQWQWGRNALADFGHTYMRGQARMKDPMFDLREMMMQQSINKNALDIADTVNKQNLASGVRIGQQKLNQYFAATIGTQEFGSDQWFSGLFEIANRYPLTDKEFGPYWERAQAVMQRNEFRKRFGPQAAPAGSGVSVSTTYKEPFTGTSVTVSDRADTKTVTQKDLEEADKFDALADIAEKNGDAATAAKHRRNAGLLRSKVEGGPSSVEGTFMRQIGALKAKIAGLKSRMAAGEKIVMQNGMPVRNDLLIKEAEAMLSELEGLLSSSSGKPVDPNDPLGLLGNEPNNQ